MGILFGSAGTIGYLEGTNDNQPTGPMTAHSIRFLHDATATVFVSRTEIEIRFADKPQEEILRALKAGGYRFSDRKWTAPITTESRAVVPMLADSAVLRSVGPKAVDLRAKFEDEVAEQVRVTAHVATALGFTGRLYLSGSNRLAPDCSILVFDATTTPDAARAFAADILAA